MQRNRLKIGTSILGGLGIGAIAMYLLDPDRGEVRRRDMSRQAGHMLSSAGSKARHMQETASSYLHQGSGYLHHAEDRARHAGGAFMQQAKSCPAMRAGMAGTAMLTAMLLGAGAMFLMDPTSGRRRRARMRDKARHYVHETSDTLTSTGRHWSNRARGLVHDAKKSVMG